MLQHNHKPIIAGRYTRGKTDSNHTNVRGVRGLNIGLYDWVISNLNLQVLVRMRKWGCES